MIAKLKLKKDVLIEELRSAIVGGKYLHGEKLPVEVELAAELQVSRDTLREALKILEDEGLLVRIRSKGTFVNLPPLAERRKILVLPTEAGKNDIAHQCHYIMPGMYEAAQEFGLTLEVCPRRYIEGQDIERIASTLQSNKELCGCILFEGLYTGRENYIRALQLSGLPVVMGACYEGDVHTTGFAGVRSNSRKAWLDGIMALKEAGHRRIAVQYSRWIQGFPFERTQEALDFLRSRGLYDPELVCDCQYDYQEIRNFLKKVMTLPEPPTAIMCYSDFFAIHTEKAAKELGISVPGQLSIMGFCGYPGGAILKPSLSTIDLQHHEIGRKAVELLARAELWFGKKEVAVPEIIVPHKLVMRESTNIKRVESLF